MKNEVTEGVVLVDLDLEVALADSFSAAFLASSFIFWTRAAWRFLASARRAASALDSALERPTVFVDLLSFLAFESSFSASCSSDFSMALPSFMRSLSRLRWKLFMVLTRMKKTQAMMRNCKTAWRNLP